MSDFLNELLLDLASYAAGRPGSGDEWLYEVFRCGFIQLDPGWKVAWGRCPRRNRYWLSRRGRLMLNIDGLVRGFQRGSWNSGD